MKYLSIIIKDLRNLLGKEPAILFLLIFMYSTVNPTLSTYMGLLLIPLLYTKGALRKFNMYICFFSICYAFFSFFNGYLSNSLGHIVFLTVYPPIFYAIGRYFICKYTNHWYTFIFIIALMLAVSVFVNVAIDISKNGFINISRQLQTADGTNTNAATLLGAQISLCLSFLGLILCPTQNKKEKAFKVLYFLLGVLAITCTLHLVTRTGLVISLFTTLCIILLNRKQLSIKQLVFILSIISVLTMFSSASSFFESSFSTLDEQYTIRNNYEGAEVTTAGDRTWRWGVGLQYLYQHPFGLDSNDTTRIYSHNFWLDINEIGGLISFILIVICSFKHLKAVISYVKGANIGLLRSLIMVMAIGFTLQLFVEPMMEAYMFYPFLYFMFMGIVDELNIQKRLVR